MSESSIPMNLEVLEGMAKGVRILPWHSGACIDLENTFFHVARLMGIPVDTPECEAYFLKATNIERVDYVLEIARACANPTGIPL